MVWPFKRNLLAIVLHGSIWIFHCFTKWNLRFFLSFDTLGINSSLLYPYIHLLLVPFHKGAFSSKVEQTFWGLTIVFAWFYLCTWKRASFALMTWLVVLKSSAFWEVCVFAVQTDSFRKISIFKRLCFQKMSLRRPFSRVFLFDGRIRVAGTSELKQKYATLNENAIV